MKKQSSGKCNLCGGTFGKAAMARHITSCKASKPADKAPKTACFHVVVEGGYGNIYWLHLAVPKDAPLGRLDKFLRETWLECCGHMSAFTIGGQRYALSPASADFDLNEESMDVHLEDVVRVGTVFLHEYDYGSTTELKLKIRGLLEVNGKSGAVQLLARNADPQFPCEECGNLATQVCTQCAYERDAFYCDKCAETHECGEEMFLPAVNSPRVGVCGYAG